MFSKLIAEGVSLFGAGDLTSVVLWCMQDNKDAENKKQLDPVFNVLREISADHSEPALYRWCYSLPSPPSQSLLN